MKQTLSCIRSIDYDYQILGHNLYQSFNLVAQRQVDPPVNTTVKEDLQSLYAKGKPYHLAIASPTLRSTETANLFADKVIVLTEFKEIQYQMEQFFSEQEFFNNEEIPRVDLARQKFFAALVHDKLGESFSQIYNRLEIGIEKILDLQKKEVLIVSHGFILKVLEVMLCHPEIKLQPELLLTYFSGDTITYGFCEGFSAEFKDRKFLEVHSFKLHKNDRQEKP